MLTRYCRCQKG